MRGLSGASAWRARNHLGSFRFLATAANPQTLIEKVVQKYAVGLPAGKVVRAGDYVMIRPEHVMTHDNTGPVISKCAPLVCDSVLTVADHVHSAFQVQIHWRYQDCQSQAACIYT